MTFKTDKQRKKVMSELNPSSKKAKKIMEDLSVSSSKPIKKWDLEVHFKNEDYEKHKVEIKSIIKDKFGLSKWDNATNEWHLPEQVKFDERTIIVRRLTDEGKTSGLMVKGSKAMADVLKAKLEQVGIPYNKIDTEKNELQERIEMSVNEWKGYINRDVVAGRITQKQANEKISKIRKLAEKYQPEIMKRREET